MAAPIPILQRMDRSNYQTTHEYESDNPQPPPPPRIVQIRTLKTTVFPTPVSLKRRGGESKKVLGTHREETVPIIARGGKENKMEGLFIPLLEESHPEKKK